MEDKEKKEDSNWVIWIIVGVILIIWIFSGGSKDDKEKYQTNKNTKVYSLKLNANNECLTAEESWDNIGENTCVEYFVANPYRSKKGNVFLNEKKDYKHAFTTVIFSKSSGNFDNNPKDYYGHETVRVNGIIKMYRGHPEIIISDPSDIEIIE